MFVLIAVRAYADALYQGRIYPGVVTAGIDVGGLTVDEATTRLSQRFDELAKAQLTVQAGDQAFHLTRSQLGFHPNAAEAARLSYEIGRTSDLLTTLLGPFAHHRVSTPLPDNLLVDDKTLGEAIAQIEARVDRPSTDATLELFPEPHVMASHSGQKFDPTRAQNDLRTSLLANPVDPIILAVDVSEPQVTTEQLEPIRGQAARILNSTFTLTDGQRRWIVPADLVRSGLVVTTNPPGLDLRTSGFQPLVRDVARQVERPVQNARLDIANGNVNLIADSKGLIVDQPGTLSGLSQSILAADSTVSVQVTQVAPSVTSADLNPVGNDARKALLKGLTLKAEDRSFPLTTTELGDLMVLKQSGGAWTLVLDRTKVSDVVQHVSQQFVHPTNQARFGWENGTVILRQPVVTVATIDENGAVDKVLTGWRGGQVDLPIVAKTVAADAELIGRLNQDLHEVLQERETSFAGSIPERANNIAVALSRIDGTYVPPGALFSFNQTVGPTTLAAGFRWGFAYAPGSTGGYQVVPSVAGGICQVATTLFQPVFWAGYTIEERHWHTFVMRHYADQGYLGLDATVSPEDGVDFKFRNDSDHGLLILAGTDGQNAKVTLIGTRPDWTVKVDPEVDSNARPAPTGVTRTTSPVFEKGREIILEEAQAGLTADVVRHVVYPDGHERTLHLTSDYQPSQLSILVGTGGSAGNSTSSTG